MGAAARNLLGKFRSFQSLAPSERARTAEAIFLLLAAEALVAAVPPRYWRRWLHGDRVENAVAPLAATQAVKHAVDRAARNVPTPARCLPQALAARQMLRRRGIGSVLHIGAAHDAGGGYAFHAWLTAGRLTVTGARAEAYRPFSPPAVVARP